MSELLSYEEYLERYGSLKYTNVGTTMLPLFRQGKDLIRLTKKGPERCHIGDIVLCRCSDGYALRRIVDVPADGYTVLGDNCDAEETGIREEDVLGVATGFVRNGRPHSIAERGYQAYSSFWLCTAPFRVASKKIAGGIKRLVNKKRPI